MPVTSAKTRTKRLQSEVMKLAYEAIFEAKAMLIQIPVRTLHHVPGFEAVLRPINSERASDLCADIMHSGFRPNEPVFTTPVMSEFDLPRHILGGNHRSMAARAAGVVLIPSHPVSHRIIVDMMALLENEIPAAMRNEESKIQIFYRCIKLLIIATQVKEPSPTPPTVLQMVSLIRTFVENDPDIREEVRRNPRAAYGGYNTLRHGIFADAPLHADNQTHFLLNKGYLDNPRHLNKCLAGSKKLIETKLRKTVPALKDRQTLLDLLLYWEHKDFVPAFNIAHLCHIGELSSEQALNIAERTTEAIYNNIRKQPELVALSEAPYTKRRVVPKSSATTRHKTTSPTVRSGAGDHAESRDEAEENDEEDDGNQESKGNGDDDFVPRRSTRKRKQVFDNLGGNYVAQQNPKRKKVGKLVKKLNKTITEDNERITNLEALLKKADVTTQNQNKAIRNYQQEIKKKIEEQKDLKQKVKEYKTNAKTPTDDMERIISRKLKAQYESDLAKVKASADAKMRDAVERAKKLNDEVLLSDMRDSVRKELELEMEAKLRDAEKSTKISDKVLADVRDTVRKELELEMQTNSTIETEQLRKENERLLRERESQAKGAMLKSDELNSLLKELEDLKKKKSAESIPDSVTVELQRLRKENEQLNLANKGADNTKEPSRARRNVLPSDKALLGLTKKQLEAFVNRANRILLEKK